MARDYAKKTAATPHGKQRPASARKGRYLILLILLCAASYYLFSSWPMFSWQQQIAKQATTLKQRLTEATTSAKTELAHKQPVFEFYTLLPKENHQGGASSDTTHRSQQLPASTPLVMGTQQAIKNEENAYTIQVGAFKQLSDADQLKAELTLKGYHVMLSRYTNNDITWYRVNVGPFSSLEQAKQSQQQLEAAHYNSLIKRIG